MVYPEEVLLLFRLLIALFYLESMRASTLEMNTEISIQNLYRLLDLDPLPEIPHWSTVNTFLERVDPNELQEIIQRLVYDLIRRRTFESSRLFDRYWQILIDGTGLYHFGTERHCEHCLKKEHKDPNGKLLYTEYYHEVLEAKLVLHEHLVFSIATEFIENEHEGVEKQDCELKAFYRMAEKLKKRFPRLPICITVDSLYAGNTTFNLCRKNQWEYLIRFKAGSIPSVAQEFNELRDLEADQTFSIREKGVEKSYSYVNGIEYGDQHFLNMLSYTEKKENEPENTFVYLSSIPVTRKNAPQLVHGGRRRWCIENEGFNRQINHGYYLEHPFSRHKIGMKCHYFLIQIAHMIAQLLEVQWKDLIEGSNLKSFHRLLRRSFQTYILPQEEEGKFHLQWI